MRKVGTIRRFKRKSLIAQLVLVCLGAELLFIASFTAFNLPIASAHNWQRYAQKKANQIYCSLPTHWQSKIQLEFSDKLAAIISPDIEQFKNIRCSLYVPLAPAAIFLGYVLGWPLALGSVAIYFFLGMIGPFLHIYPFAAGSGLQYYLEPGFGYLLGMMLAAGCVGYLSQGQRTSARQIICLLVGLLCVHLVGLAYMLGICLYDTVYDINAAQLSWSGWLFEEMRNLTWYALPYDFIFSLALIGIGFPVRWLVSMLISPDLASHSMPSEKQNLVNLNVAAR